MPSLLITALFVATMFTVSFFSIDKILTYQRLAKKQEYSNVVLAVNVCRLVRAKRLRDALRLCDSFKENWVSGWMRPIVEASMQNKPVAPLADALPKRIDEDTAPLLSLLDSINRWIYINAGTYSVLALSGVFLTSAHLLTVPVYFVFLLGPASGFLLLLSKHMETAQTIAKNLKDLGPVLGSFVESFEDCEHYCSSCECAEDCQRFNADRAHQNLGKPSS